MKKCKLLKITEEPEEPIYVQRGGRFTRVIDVDIDKDKKENKMKDMEETIKAFIIKDGSNIYCVDNPPEELQLLAIRNNLSNIEFIKTPTEVVMNYVLSKEPGYLDLVDNVTASNIFTVYKAAIISDLKYITNKSLKIKEGGLSLKDQYAHFNNLNCLKIKDSEKYFDFFIRGIEKSIEESKEEIIKGIEKIMERNEK